MWTLLTIMMLTAATIAWFLIQRLQDKPWTQQGVLPSSQDAGGYFASAPKVGLWAFLGVVTSVFLVFIGAYYMRLDTSHGGVSSGQMGMWMPLEEPPLLWFNTALLVLASVALEIARQAFRTQAIGRGRLGFTIGGALTLAFLAGQLLAWRELSAAGQTLTGGPAFAFFVLLTAVHGLHLIGGLFVLTRTAGRLWRGIEPDNKVAIAAARQSVQLCTTYWHFLLIVWIGLFAVMLST